MRLEHHLVGGYVRYISPHIIIIIIINLHTCVVQRLTFQFEIFCCATGSELCMQSAYSKQDGPHI